MIKPNYSDDDDGGGNGQGGRQKGKKADSKKINKNEIEHWI